MTIKRIFSDMDGTLLDSTGRVSVDNARAIKDADIPVTLVSARAPMEMQEAVEALELTGPQVAFNGGLIYELVNGAVHPLHVQPMPRRVVRVLLESIRQIFPQVSLTYYDMTHWYCDTIDAGVRLEHEITRQLPTVINDTERFLKGRTNTFKIMLVTTDEDVMQALQAFLAKLELSQVTIQRSGQYHLEITSKSAKKSKGIAYILAKEGLQKEETAAFGDGHNDLPMLTQVGYPIVMANAMADIKAHAYKVTKSNDQNGVAYGIHKYLKRLNHDQHSTDRKTQWLFGF